MIAVDQRVTADNPYLANRAKISNARVGFVQRASLYSALLQAPMSLLVSNVADRADVSSIAILGYN
jgi:hypothetical protein